MKKIITRNLNQAVTDFDKDFFKMPTNAIYGKTMKSVKNTV